jgi:membrane protein implicated in regulation of membrane protease activity
MKVAPMQWVFLVVALCAALAELLTGTFYLAAAAAAALLAFLIGFWVSGNLLIFAFVLLCAIMTGAVMHYRRRLARSKHLADFDIGQIVTVVSVSPRENRLVVRYRGTNWEAVMEGASAPAPGNTAVITRKTDKLLHLSPAPETPQS